MMPEEADHLRVLIVECYECTGQLKQAAGQLAIRAQEVSDIDTPMGLVLYEAVRRLELVIGKTRTDVASLYGRLELARERVLKEGEQKP